MTKVADTKRKRFANLKKKLPLVLDNLHSIPMIKKNVTLRSRRIEITEEEEDLTLDSLSQAHLDILMSLIRGHNWNHISERQFGVCIYIFLKLHGFNYRKIKSMVRTLGTIHIRTANDYSCLFINGYEESFFEMKRGKYKRSDVFDLVPELQDDIKEFTIEKVSDRNCKFTVAELLSFSLKRLNEYDARLDAKLFISRRFLDKLLINWGFYWGKNKARPYFNGHEPDDVVEDRNFR